MYCLYRGLTDYRQGQFDQNQDLKSEFFWLLESMFFNPIANKVSLKMCHFASDAECNLQSNE